MASDAGLSDGGAPDPPPVCRDAELAADARLLGFATRTLGLNAWGFPAEVELLTIQAGGETHPILRLGGEQETSRGSVSRALARDGWTAFSVASCPTEEACTPSVLLRSAAGVLRIRSTETNRRLRSILPDGRVLVTGGTLEIRDEILSRDLGDATVLPERTSFASDEPVFVAGWSPAVRRDGFTLGAPLLPGFVSADAESFRAVDDTPEAGGSPPRSVAGDWFWVILEDDPDAEEGRRLRLVSAVGAPRFITVPPESDGLARRGAFFELRDEAGAFLGLYDPLRARVVVLPDGVEPFEATLAVGSAVVIVSDRGTGEPRFRFNLPFARVEAIDVADLGAPEGATVLDGQGCGPAVAIHPTVFGGLAVALRVPGGASGVYRQTSADGDLALLGRPFHGVAGIGLAPLLVPDALWVSRATCTGERSWSDPVPADAIPGPAVQLVREGELWSPAASPVLEPDRLRGLRVDQTGTCVLWTELPAGDDDDDDDDDAGVRTVLLDVATGATATIDGVELVHLPDGADL